MCGIVGYVGYRTAQEVLIEGLHRLEYRGYDSAGVAVSHDGRIGVRKKAGRVQAVGRHAGNRSLAGTVGIGHTRWATHGATTDVNSHPHVGGNGEVVLVHNGVIENHAALRNQLQELGYVFRTGTDTEAIAHLIAHQLDEHMRQETGPRRRADLPGCDQTLGGHAERDVRAGDPLPRFAERARRGATGQPARDRRRARGVSFSPAIPVRSSASRRRSPISPITRSSCSSRRGWSCRIATRGRIRRRFISSKNISATRTAAASSITCSRRSSSSRKPSKTPCAAASTRMRPPPSSAA